MELDSFQVHRILDFCLPKSEYRGVFARDELPLIKVTLPYFACVNVKNKTSIKGHWVGLYIDRNKTGFYYCSLGSAPFAEIAKFFKINAILTLYNKRIIQNLFSNLCGFHVICVLHQLSRGKHAEDIMTQFTSNLIQNDKIVFRYIHSIVRRQT